MNVTLDQTLSPDDYAEIIEQLYPNCGKTAISSALGISRVTHDRRLTLGIKRQSDALAFRQFIGEEVTRLRTRARSVDKFTTPMLNIETIPS